MERVCGLVHMLGNRGGQISQFFYSQTSQQQGDGAKEQQGHGHTQSGGDAPGELQPAADQSHHRLGGLGQHGTQ